MSELCSRFGVSRKNGYKWLNRFLGDVGAGFEDQSRRPNTCPTAVDAAVEEAIVEARERRPRWGPKKLRAALARAEPWRHCCRRSGRLRGSSNVTVWCETAQTRGSEAVDRPTLTRDGTERPVVHRLQRRLRCRLYAVLSAHDHRRVQPLPDRLRRTSEYEDKDRHSCAFLAIFREFGLPDRIRSDNGSPFASAARAGSRSSRSGGCASALPTSALNRASRSRTVVMNASISRSNKRLRCHLEAHVAHSNEPSISFVRNTTISDHTRLSITPSPPMSTSAPLDVSANRREGPDFEYEYSSTKPFTSILAAPSVGPISVRASGSCPDGLSEVSPMS